MAMRDDDPKAVGEVEERVRRLEERLDNLLSGKVDLEVLEPQDVAVAPRSKLRVSCE